MRTSAFLRLLAAIIFASLIVPELHAASWWDEDWGVRRKITFQNSARSGSLSNFPVLICLTSSEVDYGKTQNSGQDLRFVDSNDSTLLNHEIEQWNESGTSYVWVKIPTLDASDTDFIYMYYDNSGASAPSTASQEATWSNSFESVYHLHNSNFADASGNKTTASNNGTANQNAGVAAGARTFDGNETDYIDTNWTPLYTGDFTWEGWAKTTNSIKSTDDLMGIEERFWDPGCGGSGCYRGDRSEIRWALRENKSGGSNPVNMYENFLWPDSGTSYSYTPDPITMSSAWHYLVIERDGSTARTFLDGSQIDSASVGSGQIDFPTYTSLWSSTTVTLLIGGQWDTDQADGSIRNWFEGDVDEIRTSIGVARSADWVEATFDNISSCGSFTDITQETTEAGLVSFEASAGDQQVELVWETGSEIENHGFHLYRATEEDGDYSRISSNVIPGLGSSAEGAKYSYLDTGLRNGETYYYRLEDIETTGETQMRGPISATPEAGATAVVGEAEGQAARIAYGRPRENELRLHQVGRRGWELELITEGFYAYPEDDGSVRLVVPGLDLVAEPGEPAVPVYRGWVDALVGNKVHIGQVRAENVQVFTGLRPSETTAPAVIGSSDGIAQVGERKARRAFLHQGGLYPESVAQLIDVAFQQDDKKALVELAPLRWDGDSGRLLLARSLRVRIQFQGQEPGEVVRGGKGRRHLENHQERGVLAQFATQAPGVYGARFEDVFGNRGRARKTSELRLSRQGETVAFRVIPEGKQFKPGSMLYFVSAGADTNPYGHEAVFELEASRSGVVMESVNGAPEGIPVPSYWKTVRLEENRLYQSAYVDAEDIWQWDWIFGPMSKTFPFRAENLASVSSSSHLEVWLQGASDFPQLDHHARIYVNGTFVAEDWWDGELPIHLTAELGAGVLVEGDNVLQIEEVGDTAAPYSMIMLDRFEVRHPADLVTDTGRLEGSFDQPGAAWVSGLEDAQVFDVSGEQPRWLNGVNRTEGVGFGVEEGHRYLVVGSEGLLSPEIRQPLQTSLRAETNAAEYVVIGPRAFLSAAEPLLRYRMDEGLRTKAVAIEDVFAEFGYGETTPEAIRDFLSYVYHHWNEPSLRYVLLLGDGTYDSKDYLGTGVENHVPVKLVKTTYLWTASDPWFGAVNGEDLLPDVAIGRLPAASVEEVESLVEKILAYERGQGDPEAPVVLVTDNPDGAGDFDWNADVLAATVLADENVEKIYLSKLGTTATRSAIMNAFDDGASIMSYIGHGAIHLWANENLLNIGQMDSLSPQSQQPLLFTMNCLNGYFHFPYHDSLAEALLKAEGKGIIAAFSPTGLSLNDPAHRFHRAMLDHVVHQNHERLGDAILAGQADYADSGAFPELLSIYHLLGDPALNLR